MDDADFGAGGTGRDDANDNGPKGMALVGDTLWVADVDAVRAFNRKTGAPACGRPLAGSASLRPSRPPVCW